jgi:hypothetical protein
MMKHTAIRGVSLVAVPCECGAALTRHIKDDHGRFWSVCPRDPADWLAAFRLLNDQSEAGYLVLVEHNTQHGPAVTAQLLNLGARVEPAFPPSETRVKR